MYYGDFDRKLVAQIKEGMAVYDASQRRIGVVDFVRFGDENPDNHSVDTLSGTSLEENDSLADILTRGLTGEGELPDEVRSRLMRYGFIRIDEGVLRSECYVMPTQISSIHDGEIHLNVDDDELTRPA